MPPIKPTLPATLVDNYWAEFLGCTPEQLLSDGNVHRLTGSKHQNIWAIARHSSWVVIVPASWPQVICKQVYRCFEPNLLPDATQLQGLLDQIGHQQLYGPALILLHDRSRDPQPSRSDNRSLLVRPLTRMDDAQVSSFCTAASPIVWTLQEPALWPKIFGVFVDEQLVATCGVRIWGELLAELYVDTLPTQRRRGYGKIATDTALQWVHNESPYLAESVVELANEASWRLMHHAGFTPYAHMLISFATE